MRQGVEEAIGRSVVALAGGTEEAGDGGEKNEGGQFPVPGEVVEMPSGVEFGREDLGEAYGRQGRQHAVSEGAGGMPDGGQRVARGDGFYERPQSLAVGNVAACD